MIIAPHATPRPALLPAAVRRLLPDHSEATLALIERVVAKEYHVALHQIRSRSRVQAVVGARQMTHYLAVTLTGLSTVELGHYYGKDHSAIIYSCATVRDYASVYPEVAATIDNLRAKITEAGRGTA